MNIKILCIAGSLRKDSLNKKLLKIAMSGAAAAGAKVTYVDLKDYPLPIYDGDLESSSGLPENAVKLKAIFKEHDGLLFASPEYNSSYSAAWKNCIDWVSRPVEGEKPLSCFSGKIAGLMSASPGATGGMRALVHVRAILENIQVMVVPEQQSIPQANSAFSEDGEHLNDAKKDAAVRNIGARVAEVCSRLAKVENAR